MVRRYRGLLTAMPVIAFWAVCLFALGCNSVGYPRQIDERRFGPRLATAAPGNADNGPNPDDVPNEWRKFVEPEYTISPPDILQIDALALIPRPPYKIAPLDGLVIRVTVVTPKDDQKPNELLPRQPIDGVYRVEADGNVNLGFDYGSVQVARMTIPEAQKAITQFLKQRFTPEILLTVALFESRGLQQIRGEHLVRQDGKVTLGMYGSVYVADMTLEQAKLTIETYLSKFLLDPEISIDVTGYNSKVYYIIVDLYAAGEQVIRLPITGNQTVLDAIGEIKGLPSGTDRKRIVLARRTAPDQQCCEVYPVDWEAITRCGSTATNYQIFPGDRIYVGVDPWIKADGFLAKVIAPFERIFGIVLLGTSTVQTLSQPLGGSTTNGTGGSGLVTP